MTDPYRAPRIQRIVPWRRPLGSTATEIALMAGATRHRMRAAIRKIDDNVTKAMVRLVLATYAAEEALESGALPGEFAASELRLPELIRFSSPENKHSGGLPTNYA